MKYILFTLIFSTFALAAETTPPAPEAPANLSPKQVCEALAKAATDNNFEAFSNLTAMPMMAAGGMHGHEGMPCDGKSCPMHKGEKGMAKGDHNAPCPMHAKGGEHKCNGKNCPMHKGGKGMAKGDHNAPCPMMEGKPGEGFAKMHEQEMKRLKALVCKDEKIAEDHAWVEATSQNETRLVPFKKMDGQWKFDMRTYHSFYQPPMPSEGVKK